MPNPTTRSLWTSLALCSLGMLAFNAAAAADAVQTMQAFHVSAQRATATEAEGPQPIDHYDSEQINDSGAFTVDELIATLPPAENGNEVLVLIDGQPAYIDPASLPLNMIEGIEVSRDGTMPAYGAYAAGQVINIRLKKDYRGAELGAKFRDSLDGGGDQRTGRVSSGFTRGKLNALFSLDHSETGFLRATQRDFSRNQNHTNRGGRDLRLSWGYPAAIQAATGTLAGLTDAAGNPVRAALVPAAQRGDALTAADFIPATPPDAGAADQRRFDTASYRSLISPSTRTGGNLSFNYALSDRLNLSLSGTYSETRSEREGAPPVTPTSAASRVPAAYTPFGQEVDVGLVHVEFGPTRQVSRGRNTQIGARLSGRVGDTWRWNGGVSHRRTETQQVATDLDPAKFAASLAEPDPALRFNPFGDATAGPVNAHLYPAFTVERTRDDINRDTRLDLSANGQLWQIRGVPLTLSLRGNYNDRERDRISRNAIDTTTPTTHQQRGAYSTASTLTVPLVGAPNARLLFRRVEAQISARYAGQDDDSGSRDADIGLVWVPWKPLLLRFRHVTQTTTPPRSIIAESQSLVGETFVDPARGSMAVSDVRVFTRDSITAAEERSERQSFGLTFEPPWAKGLHLSASYDTRRRENLFENGFDAQDIINNELFFPGRVIRAAPSAEDAAARLPGPIIAVDTSPGNTGRAESQEADFSVEYRLPWQQFGRFRFTAFGERSLDSQHEVKPGVAFVHEATDDLNPPDWRFQGTLAWNLRAWNAAVRARHIGAVSAGNGGIGIPATTVIDFNAGYRFRQSLWRQFGRGLQVGIGLDNVFDEPPPFADTLNGFRGGSPLGRTYTCSFTLPL